MKGPKAPKASASLAVLERYLERCDNVAKANSAKYKEYKAKVDARAKEVAKKAKIRKDAKATLARPTAKKGMK